MRRQLAWDGRETYEATVREALIDDELWPPLLHAIASASRRIDLSQLLFEPDFRPSVPLARTLTDELEAAATRGVRVRILVNENAAIPDSYDEVRDRFLGTRVEVCSLPMTPNVMHMKVLLADDVAFMVDAPFEQKYADARTHVFHNPSRRGWQPFHSVSLRLEGPIVARISQLYDALWDGTPLPPPAAPPAQGGVQLVWSAPAGVWSPDAAEGVVRSYELAIAQARRFVYCENQYFTSPRITRALQEALEREPQLEVILALNEHMDVPTYDVWQERRLRELGYPDHPRLGAFSLWTPRRLPDDPAARRIYIHSKVSIVDDAWATVGSANLDSISLHDAEEFGITAPRNVELNAVFTEEPFVATLRRRLWGEHLGDEGVWSAQAPPEGWLAHWRRIAGDNLRRFDAGEGHGPARVMPFAGLTTSGRKRLSSEPPASP